MKLSMMASGHNSVMPFSGILIVLALILSGQSCGYKFAGSGELPNNVKSIYIKILENRSGETRIENVFSNDLIDEITKRDPSMLQRKDTAEAFLTGIVQTIFVKDISHIDSNQSFQRRVTAIVDMKLTETKTNVTIWERKQITESEAYDVDQGDRFLTDQNRREALEKISERFAEKVYMLLTDNF